MNAIEVLYEALDGIVEDMPEERLLELAEHLYSHGDTNRCPICKSADISGGRLDADGSEAWQEIRCEECGAEWQDLFTSLHCDFTFHKEDGLPENWQDLFVGAWRRGVEERAA